MGRSFFHNNRLYFDDKMKRHFIILLMSLVSFAVPAQNNQKIIDHINQVAHSLKSMQADFVQTKTMKMLTISRVINCIGNIQIRTVIPSFSMVTRFFSRKEHVRMSLT